MSAGSVAGVATTKLRVQVSAWGAWWVDADLAEPETLAGAVEVIALDKTLQGTIVSGGVQNGRASYRIVGGRGGWGQDVPHKPYRDSAGVRAAKVLADAASAAGETVGALPTTRLGQHYARPAGPASTVLHAVAPRAWYVDFDGVTQFGARAAAVYAGGGVRTREDLGAGILELTADEIGNLLPGVTVDGFSQPATDVEYTIDANKLVVRIYTGARSSRRLDAIRRLILSLFPQLRYSGAFEYRVVTQSGDRLNLQPVRVVHGMPDLAGVPVRPGMAGLKAEVTPGELVLVVFADNDPSRPNVIAHDAPDAPGWMPISLELGGPTTFGVLHENTIITCPAGTCVVTPGTSSNVVKVAP